MVGKAIAHYQIEARLGAGGMGEVYQARDTRLGRSVAVKMLPEIFERDPDRIARFEREAKLLASLNHPNIAALYGLEQSDGKHFLVMELVDGETVAERIRRGPVPAEEALKIAHQIAGALEAAHEKNVVHRDLKPANVKITPEGKVKVLDFGLAKALEGAPAEVTSNSPTLLSAAASSPGMILGTAGYMSPEQARGHDDPRSDIFSFGCVLYEMLTGRQTFTGETVTDIIASVVARDPDFSALPANLHPQTPDLIRRCLAKNRKDRWHAIADVRVELESIITDPHGLKFQAARDIPRPPLWKRAVPFAITTAVVAVIAVATTVVLMNTRPSPPAAVTRFPFVYPEGQRVVFTSDREGDQGLFWQRADGGSAERLAKVEQGSQPQSDSWSPDGKQLFFLKSGTRQKIMAVDIQTQRGFVFGKTTGLPVEGIIPNGPRYDITPDGKYFVAVVSKSQTQPDKAPSEQINITLNWFEELKQRVPVK